MSRNHVTAGMCSRRSFLRAGAALAGLGTLGWKDAVRLSADEVRRQGMHCILLFMNGGPSQFETFDPKPGTETGGPTEAIDTAVPGIRIAKPWQHVAAAMKDISLVRTVSSNDGEHLRASYLIHTGYAPLGNIKHPTMGSVVANEIGPEDADLPHFVNVTDVTAPLGAGFLGVKVAPFLVADPSKVPDNVALPAGISSQRLGDRLQLLKDLEKHQVGAPGSLIQDHTALYDRTSRMVRSQRLEAFDVSKEKASVRKQFGETRFGKSCLLALRLVEAGTTFVEVDSKGWDTHDDNFAQVNKLSQEVDPALAALVTSLKERGLLEKTLVVWMGEFGRTPKINAHAKPGRDHYPKSFSVALAGGGIQGGRVIGSTSANGADIKERPVPIADLLCTIYHSLKINPRKQFVTPLGRPIKIVEGGHAVEELF